ncbi:MAG: BamA/TamA family outer membrane protein [Myxococcota bacterium]
MIALGAALALITASPPPDGGREPERDSYETERVTRALEAAHRTVDLAPDGKRIRKIVIVRDDVFAEDEPFPTFLNVFHALTEEDVVARELLFKRGDVWSWPRVEESIRNLRDQTTFALVRIVPVVPDDPSFAPDGTAASSDAVDAFVYTRDIWSLRLESAFSLTAGFLDNLSLTLIERNLAGRNVQAAVSFDLNPRSFSLGELFIDRRLFSSRWSLSQSFDLIFERESGSPEGTTGTLVFGLPLYDLQPRWGVELGLAWNDSVGRQLSGDELLTWTAPEPNPDGSARAVPRIWDQTIVKLTLSALRQLGEDTLKVRLSYGFGAYVTDFEPHPDTGLAGLPDSDPVLQAFRDEVLPRARTQLYPYIRAEAFVADYARFVDLAGFGITEDVRTGPWVSAFFAAPLEAFGSDDDALAWDASAGLILAPRSPWGSGRALFDVMAGLSQRLEQSEVIDQVYRVRLRMASPCFLLGRVVASGDVQVRGKDSNETLVTLGGDNGLRGYASQAFYGFGADRVRLSAELRTGPAVLGSIHFGGVLFYDAGGVGDLAGDFQFHHAVGVGLRLMMPQLNRFVFRFDVGFPLDADHVTVLLNIGTNQAVPLTTLEDQRLDQ